MSVGFRLLVGAALLITASMVGASNAAAQETSVWTGDVSEYWFDPANWRSGSVPSPWDSVLIETFEPHAPVISGGDAFAASVRVATILTVESGGRLSVTDGGVRVERSGVLVLSDVSVDGAVSNDGRVFVRGGTADVGSYDASSGGLLMFEPLSGADSLSVAGEARLDGGRLIAIVTSSDPPPGTVHRVLTAGTRVGTFAFTDTGPYSVRYDDTGVELYIPTATTTTIIADSPDPSTTDEPYTVQVAVASQAPGAGIPTGRVVVSDDNGASCTIVSLVDGTGACQLTSAAGARTLTAEYAGDTNFSGSVSAAEPHLVEPAVVSIGDVAVAEGSSGITAATFAVSIDRASAREVSVHFATANGTASAPADYGASSGDLTFAPGETTKQVAVQIAGDTVDELDETFTVALSGVTGATLGDGTGVGTIIDDDRDGGFSCTASALALLGSQPVVANPTNTPCEDDAKQAASLNVNLGLLRIQATGPQATTDQVPNVLAGTHPAPGDAAVSTAQLETTRISMIGLTIDIGAISSTASVRCQGQPAGGLAPAYSGSSSIGTLKVNGVAVPIGSGTVTIPLLLGTLKLNSTATTATGVTQRALELRSPLGNVVVGEARAGVTDTPVHPNGNPCRG